MQFEIYLRLKRWIRKFIYQKKMLLYFLYECILNLREKLRKELRWSVRFGFGVIQPWDEIFARSAHPNPVNSVNLARPRVQSSVQTQSSVNPTWRETRIHVESCIKLNSFEGEHDPSIQSW